ncbi:hypothetical protein F4803DRAFT_550217 [Xylaria telfairii]|nr:hypothetical protein F4803DRAFT_550217 [Xylaria telfairii]
MATATCKSGSNESTHHGISVPLRAEMSPMAAIEQNALAKERGMVTACQTGGVATFIIPGEPDAVKGVIKAVYNDLKDGNKDANIEFRETTVPYIRVHAPTEKDALALIRTAQRLAIAHLSGDSTEAKAIFVEPPMNCMTTNFEIDVHVFDTTKYARHTLERIPGTLDMVRTPSLGRYKRELSQSLCESFEKASNLHTSLSLKIYLGCYLLHTYKTGKFTLEQFETIVKHPRATGKLNTCLGKAPFAEGLNIGATLSLIQAASSPCIPLDNQTATSADVTPTYVLEIWHGNDCYEAELDISRAKQDPANERPTYTVARTKMIPQSAQVPRFEATSLSIGRKLDWKIAAMPGDEKVSVSLAVKQYLESGNAVMQGRPNDFHCYPKVRLPEKCALADKLKSAVMKSIYRFSWGRTGYIVEFTINRRWKSIREMNRQAPMETDFNITVYADNWDQDSRVQAGETVGKIWGADLQGLLRDEAGDRLNRVQGLIKTILDICDFFDGPGVEQ